MLTEENIEKAYKEGKALAEANVSNQLLKDANEGFAKAWVAATFDYNADQAATLLKVEAGSGGVLDTLLGHYQEIADRAADSAAHSARLAIEAAVMLRLKIQLPQAQNSFSLADVDRSVANAQMYCKQAQIALSDARDAVELYADIKE